MGCRLCCLVVCLERRVSVASGVVMSKLGPDRVSGSRVFRVFVSSTFRDMAAERDVLVKRVFPTFACVV